MTTTTITTTTTLLCQACHRPIGDRPAVLCPAPAGGQPWALHRDVADCVSALAERPGDDRRFWGVRIGRTI